MGSADIIPGVSGGTIALITGIYERFVLALKSVNFTFIFYFFKGFIDRRYFKKSKEKFLSIDFAFLLPLAAGVGLAFLLLANIMSFLLSSYPSYTYGFFFGLILGSAFVIYLLNKKNFKIYSFVFLILGFIFGFLIVGLDAIQADHSLIIIFFSGLISFCAMILPGISGAFILLILGQYEFMLSVLKDIANFDFSGIFYAISYVIGGITGLLLFSRVLSFLLKRYHAATLLFIIGLMLGALREPFEVITGSFSNIFLIFFIGAIGVLCVVLLSFFSIKKNKSLG